MKLSVSNGFCDQQYRFCLYWELALFGRDFVVLMTRRLGCSSQGRLMRKALLNPDPQHTLFWRVDVTLGRYLYEF